MPKITKPAAVTAMETEGQPYSLLLQFGDQYQSSGLVSIDGDKQPIGDVNAQIVAVISTVKRLLEACELTVNDIFKADARFVGDMDAFAFFNEQWMKTFNEVYLKPTRMAYAAAALPFSCDFEFQFLAVRQD